MARNMYVIIDEEEGHIVRSGFFGRQLFTNKREAKKVASGEDNAEVYKLTKHGV